MSNLETIDYSTLPQQDLKKEFDHSTRNIALKSLGASLLGLTALPEIYLAMAQPGPEAASALPALVWDAGFAALACTSLYFVSRLGEDINHNIQARRQIRQALTQKQAAS